MKEKNVKCATCGEPIYRSPRQIAKSKTGLFYCCKQHQKKWRFYKRTSYRKLAFDNYPHRCDECNYSNITDILEVHHVDFNHNNNNLDNLQILCPNCHRELHYMARIEWAMEASYDPEFEDPDWED